MMGCLCGRLRLGVPVGTLCPVPALACSFLGDFHPGGFGAKLAATGISGTCCCGNRLCTRSFARVGASSSSSTCIVCLRMSPTAPAKADTVEKRADIEPRDTMEERDPMEAREKGGRPSDGARGTKARSDGRSGLVRTLARPRGPSLSGASSGTINATDCRGRDGFGRAIEDRSAVAGDPDATPLSPDTVLAERLAPGISRVSISPASSTVESTSLAAGDDAGDGVACGRTAGSGGCVTQITNGGGGGRPVWSQSDPSASLAESPAA
mmetsp:Transcript_8344/g.18073  ORF Transcript_8344/g.18073 Transcript_8344/m.18073 type:complete len:267 (+) Transcript_8344:256-1056(+)